MRLLVYKDSLSVGRGADKAVKSFSAELAARGHDVRLVERDAFPAALGERWDAIVATGSNEAVDLDRAGYFERPVRSPVVLQLHLAPRGFFKWKHPFRNRAIKRAFCKVDAVQLLCSDYVEEFRGIAPGVKTRVIGNYTDMEIPSLEGHASASGGKMPIILYPAAAFSRVKNQRLLIEAFAKIAGDFPGWKVRLLGNAATKSAALCRALANKLGVADRVEFAGFTNDLAGEYSRAAFVAFPSGLEGFPLAVLEAARFALPVVAHEALPGVRDIVIDGKTGLVTKPSVQEYAKGLSLVMADESLRRKLGDGARMRCAELYSKESVLGAWENLLMEVAGE